ncbi:ATP-binding protein [Promethearchaeum syntrophicum]|uniref:ATP-binding protein n=1 Tax=Promethearchaeum syntrophicum TaxID=2594042 RepID=A0A5B9DEA6_9ARCH|nr:ATP-binding protein [Candidatus Prometheoarchaeum syntrophicum]QEE17103.1 hypothetical protein DSAG12_02935 [Candidatus Prometheoarchaeum syntrophicum]
MQIKSKYIQNWDNVDSSRGKDVSKIPLIHIIGYIGAGKSTFIKKYLRKYPTFDIKEIYQKNFFTPKDLLENPRKYSQFQSALDYSFSQFYKKLEINHIPIGIVESSGINRALNNILRRFFVYRIWIIPFNLNQFETQIYKERPYAKELNSDLKVKFKQNKIPFNNQYNFIEDSFMKDLPAIFTIFFKL